MNIISKLVIYAALILSGVNLSAQTSRELTLPQVPANLKDVKLRAAYVLNHFWDNMDFTDIAALNDNNFMEQNFANFASIMPVADLDSLSSAARNLLLRLHDNPIAYNKILELAEIYLYDYNSPVRYEQAFIPFAETALNDSVIGSTPRLRLEFFLEEAHKNAPGSKIPDIEVLDNSSVKTTLYEALPKSPYTLVYLFDPECSHCISLIAALNDDPILKTALDSKKISIVAVNIMGENKIKESIELLPRNWISLAAVDEEFNDTEAFSLPSLPVIYLIDSEGTIILKEANPQQLIETIVNL